MLKIKAEVAGLYLWSVRLTGPNGDCPYNDLWITTKRNSIADAAKKAEKFLRKNKQYPEATIGTISTSGTLDA